MFSEELCGSNIAFWNSPRATFSSVLWMSGSPSHSITDVCLPCRLVRISSYFFVLFCVFACLIDAVLCLCSVHCVCILRTVFLVCAAFASAIWCLDDCVPLLAWLFCVCLCMSYLCRVWSVQLTAPGLAGHHGHSVQCPVEAGTINERAHAPAPPLPMEGTSASACTQRRPFATHTPVMVRSAPIQDHEWEKTMF